MIVIGSHTGNSHGVDKCPYKEDHQDEYRVWEFPVFDNCEEGVPVGSEREDAAKTTSAEMLTLR